MAWPQGLWTLACEPPPYEAEAGTPSGTTHLVGSACGDPFSLVFDSSKLLKNIYKGMEYLNEGFEA